MTTTPHPAPELVKGVVLSAWDHFGGREHRWQVVALHHGQPGCEALVELRPLTSAPGRSPANGPGAGELVHERVFVPLVILRARVPVVPG